ncbi:UDP-glucose/GDP-mannose dehydrogenase family protein [Dysgonomonas sp. HDW5B]|uniref:UDP-glucose dehydrogenase family protein n=1 Tax=Dysgonomonas sp. HDW5B TaxID=2714927 RepID=UPI00140A990D|nr:UDP-glucose/GDP-mannose dehydrogenase family protein [Dysgonomonas sp. HDW5B]QIK54844.1 UDP-glucose/GDP-mannose dehydrogenase family protein [Dysgonomonas sp. HDW5B]
MNIAIVGSGYVGLVTGTCFAEIGANVTCIDIDENKIKNLKLGNIPIYEPGLEAMIKRNVEAKRLNFSTDLASVMDHIDIIFIAVGTPPDEDGSADLKYVINVAQAIGANMKNYLVVVTKSTVPVGTSIKIKNTIQEQLDKRNLSIEFDVASNPEFLKEGNAIDDFMKPDRVVIGIESERAKKILTRLYKSMHLNTFRVIFMDIASAEMTKYAANSMLATRISFMNEIANLCELVGANVSMVRKGMGSDNRIGSKFLYSGCGYGGSCFPKDVKALIKIGHLNDSEMQILNAVEAVNEQQKNILFKKFQNHFGGKVKDKKVAIWGLSFKPETDDMREAPSINLMKSLLDVGCSITVYDPIAMPECKRIMGNKVKYANNMYDAVIDANTIFHVTEWKEFRLASWEAIKRSMATDPLLIDGRNVFSKEDIAGINYIRIG